MSVKLASTILDKLGVSPVQVLKYRYDIKSDQDLVDEIADILNVTNDPVKRIIELEDKPSKCYVWKIDATDKQTAELQRKAEKAFVKKYNRDPEALHFIRNDIKEIEELDPDLVREKVGPWLNEVEE